MLVSILDQAREQGSTLGSLRIVNGLDAPDTIERLHEETGADFWSGFGQTETTGWVTLQRFRDRPGAAGVPGPVCRVRVVDDYDRDVPTGTPGEILARGPTVFQGYFDQPEVNEYTFRGGWHHTGDVGRFDEDGYLHYVRRKPEKELIKPGGENVYPAEVETTIVELPEASAACVFGVPDRKWGEGIMAVVETAGGLTPERVIDHVGRAHRPLQAPAARRVHRRASPRRQRGDRSRSGQVEVGRNRLRIGRVHAIAPHPRRVRTPAGRATLYARPRAQASGAAARGAAAFRRHPSAVTGSIILRTSVTMLAGNPLLSACSWMSSSLSAR